MLIGITFQSVYIVFFEEHLTHGFIFRSDSKRFYLVGINNPKSRLECKHLFVIEMLFTILVNEWEGMTVF